jgi:hypothetical protein
MTGKGSMLVKCRRREDAWASCAPLIWVLESQPSGRCVLDSGPPPPLKGRKAGGSGITLSAIDPGASIIFVEEM